MPAKTPKTLGQIVRVISDNGLVSGEPKKELVAGIAESWADVLAHLVVETMEKRHLITIRAGRVYPKRR